MATTLFVLWKLFLPLLFVIALLDLLTMAPERKIRFLRSTGLSQKAIAERLGLTTYRVRKALAV